MFYGSLYKHPREKVFKAYQLFRDMGCTGGMVYTGSGRIYRQEHSLELHVEDNFPFYVENLVAPFVTGWDEGKKQFFRQYEEFGQTRDRRVFTKVPCLNDPKLVADQQAHVRQVMTELAPGRHLARYYDIRDEPSTGSVSPAAIMRRRASSVARSITSSCAGKRGSAPFFLNSSS